MCHFPRSASHLTRRSVTLPNAILQFDTVDLVCLKQPRSAPKVAISEKDIQLRPRLI